MRIDDVELNGMTIGELDLLAQDVDSCLSVDPKDVTCLDDSHRVARGVLKLIDRDRLIASYLAAVSRNLDVVKSAIDRIEELNK